jgi:hemoglobin
MKKNIENQEDIKLLVDSFYKKVNADSLLGPVFNDEAQTDWSTHLPKMYSFWGTQLIGTMDYKGQPFPPHMRVVIDPRHFERWLRLFTETLDELFEGDIAELAKYKAQNIARIFQYKLGFSDKDQQENP